MIEKRKRDGAWVGRGVENVSVVPRNRRGITTRRSLIANEARRPRRCPRIPIYTRILYKLSYKKNLSVQREERSTCIPKKYRNFGSVFSSSIAVSSTVFQFVSSSPIPYGSLSVTVGKSPSFLHPFRIVTRTWRKLYTHDDSLACVKKKNYDVMNHRNRRCCKKLVAYEYI